MTITKIVRNSASQFMACRLVSSKRIELTTFIPKQKIKINTNLITVKNVNKITQK